MECNASDCSCAVFSAHHIWHERCKSCYHNKSAHVGKANGAKKAQADCSWIRTIDEKTGKSYFFHKLTKTVVWKTPADYVEPEWIEAVDQASRLKYYFHRKTRQRQWEKPSYFMPFHVHRVHQRWSRKNEMLEPPSATPLTPTSDFSDASSIPLAPVERRDSVCDYESDMEGFIHDQSPSTSSTRSLSRSASAVLASVQHAEAARARKLSREFESQKAAQIHRSVRRSRSRSVSSNSSLSLSGELGKPPTAPTARGDDIVSAASNALSDIRRAKHQSSRERAKKRLSRTYSGDWRQAYDPAMKKIYYYNRITKQTRWTPPPLPSGEVPAFVSKKKKPVAEDKDKAIMKAVEADYLLARSNGKPVGGKKEVSPDQSPPSTLSQGDSAETPVMKRSGRASFLKVSTRKSSMDHSPSFPSERVTPDSGYFSIIDNHSDSDEVETAPSAPPRHSPRTNSAPSSPMKPYNRLKSQNISGLDIGAPKRKPVSLNPSYLSVQDNLEESVNSSNSGSTTPQPSIYMAAMAYPDDDMAVQNASKEAKRLRRQPSVSEPNSAVRKHEHLVFKDTPDSSPLRAHMKHHASSGILKRSDSPKKKPNRARTLPRSLMPSHREKALNAHREAANTLDKDNKFISFLKRTAMANGDSNENDLQTANGRREGPTIGPSPEEKKAAAKKRAASKMSVSSINSKLAARKKRPASARPGLFSARNGTSSRNSSRNSSPDQPPATNGKGSRIGYIKDRQARKKPETARRARPSPASGRRQQARTLDAGKSKRKGKPKANGKSPKVARSSAKQKAAGKENPKLNGRPRDVKRRSPR